MHVLTATSATQGERDTDFCFALEGELVQLPSTECSNPDRCGCGRGFAGMGSHLATTTALVSDRPDLDPDDVAELIWQDLIGQGVPALPELRTAVELQTHDLARLADGLPAGTIVERNGATVSVRRLPRHQGSVSDQPDGGA